MGEDPNLISSYGRMDGSSSALSNGRHLLAGYAGSRRGGEVPKVGHFRRAKDRKRRRPRAALSPSVSRETMRQCREERR